MHRRLERVSAPVAQRFPGMRVTHRTLRVMCALAEHPGSSNREVARAAGISDRAQISKLLARLADLGLIEKAGSHHLGRPSNAWRLTTRGREFVRAARAGPLR